MAWLFLWPLTFPLLAQSPPDENSARAAFSQARSRFEAARANVELACDLGRAAFDLAELIQNDDERNEVAQTGIEVCRQAAALEPDSARAHYYLALNLGESARTKKLAALKLLREMEHELLKAAKLDSKLDYGGPDRALGMLYLEAPSWPASIGSRKKARAHLATAVEISPELPDNHISLAEAYAKWGELRSLEQELAALEELLPKARAQFTGEGWKASWKDWEERLQKLKSAQEHLAGHTRASPAERGAHRRR